MGEIDNINDSPYFDGWEGYVDAQLQENAPTRDEYFGFNEGKGDGEEPGIVQQTVGGAIKDANSFLKENLQKPIEDKLEGTIFGSVESASGGGEGTGKPARMSFHNFKKDPICVQNCIVQCPFGMTFCKIDPTPTIRPAKVQGLMDNQMLTINDHFAFTNVFPYNLFTLCQNPFNPYVIWATALATVAKGAYTFTPWPCAGSMPLFSYVQPFWKPTQGQVKTNGMLALTQSSTISCWWPAELAIVHPGQGLDDSWGKAMFLGPGGLAGIQNIVNMAGSVFSLGGGFAKDGFAEFLNKGSSVFDLLDGSINLMSGDIIGALFSGASGYLGIRGDNSAINRGIKKVSDYTADLFNHGIKRLEIADVRRSVRALGDDLPPQARRQFNDACDRAETMNAHHPQHNTDGSVTPANTPHGDTITVGSNHPRTGGAASGSDKWSAKYRSEADVPTVEKRKQAREDYRKWESAKDNARRYPDVSQKEKDHLKDLEAKKTAAHENLKQHPEPSSAEMDRKKAQSDASRQQLESTQKPPDPDYSTLKAKEKAMKDAQAKIDKNTVTPEERQHLADLEQKANETRQAYTDNISMANNEADIKAQRALEKEKARIAEKERLYKEGQQEIGPATDEYTHQRKAVEEAETAQREYDALNRKAEADENAYLAEKRDYEQKMNEHNKAQKKADQADEAYTQENQRQKDKENRHNEAVAEAERLKPDEKTKKLGEEQDKLSDSYKDIASKASEPAKNDIKDGINKWIDDAAPDKEAEKPKTPDIDTSWVGYDFSLDYC